MENTKNKVHFDDKDTTWQKILSPETQKVFKKLEKLHEKQKEQYYTQMVTLRKAVRPIYGNKMMVWDGQKLVPITEKTILNGEEYYVIKEK